MAAFDPLPIGNLLVEPKTGRMTDSWVGWLEPLVALVYRASVKMFPVVNLTTQSASIASTALPAVKYNGLYRISYFIHITRAATTSSSVTLNFSFTSDGIALSISSIAVTGNTTGTFYGQGPLFIYIDGGTAPTYSVNYASVGATSAQYRVCVLMEQVDV